MTDIKKCCGTCKLWDKDTDPSYCAFPQPPLPFWAHLGNGDHGEYTEYEDGQRCEVHEPCDVS